MTVNIKRDGKFGKPTCHEVIKFNFVAHGDINVSLWIQTEKLSCGSYNFSIFTFLSDMSLIFSLCRTKKQRDKQVRKVDTEVKTAVDTLVWSHQSCALTAVAAVNNSCL